MADLRQLARGAVDDACIWCGEGTGSRTEAGCKGCPTWDLHCELDRLDREEASAAKAMRCCGIVSYRTLTGGVRLLCQHASYHYGTGNVTTDKDGHTWVDMGGSGFKCALGRDTSWVARDGCEAFGERGATAADGKVSAATAAVAGHPTCTCPTECDCQCPEPERGAAGVSAHCPVHNYRPRPYPDCPVHGEASAATVTEGKPPCATCDRCGKPIEGYRPPSGGMTAGYYIVDDGCWSKYRHGEERIVCDACMWADPVYRKDYPGHARMPQPPCPKCKGTKRVKCPKHPAKRDPKTGYLCDEDENLSMCPKDADDDCTIPCDCEGETETVLGVKEK